MSKGTETFKKTIQDYLNKRAEQDSLFAETLKKENKNIDECVNYILSEVRKSGCNGFADEEIFGMAVHYYDEDDIKAGTFKSMKVIVNHHVELSEEDKKQAKSQAMQEAISEAKEEAKKNLSEKIELSEEDIQDAKNLAIEKIAIDQKEKLVQKATKKQLKEVSKKTNEVEQINLFT
jgi:hypothetical protein